MYLYIYIIYIYVYVYPYQGGAGITGMLVTWKQLWCEVLWLGRQDEQPPLLLC